MNRSYLTQLSLHQKNPQKWISWGKKLLKQGKNPFEIFYTPGIGEIILLGKKKREKLDLPPALQPLSLEPRLSTLYRENKNLFRKKLFTLLEEKVSQIENLRGVNRRPTQGKNLLSGWGAVVTNKKRVLGFGEVPDGGEWITRGKCDCYEMATEGKIWKMLALAIDVSEITDSRQHDQYVFAILKILQSTRISLIQFEDFDGISAFRILKKARKILHVPLFNDDIEGTAWILWMAKLAAKGRSIITSSKFKVQSSKLNLKAHDIRKIKFLLRSESVHARKEGTLLFRDSLFFFHGGGAAAIGGGIFFKKMLLKMYLHSGISKVQAIRLINRQIILTDSHGLLYKGRTSKIKEGQKQEFKPFQKDLLLREKRILERLNARGQIISLEKCIDFYGQHFLGRNGTIFLIGLTGHPGQFNEKVIRTARTVVNMHNPHSDIFIDSGSNPTYLTEILTKKESHLFQKSSPDEQRKILAQAVLRVKKAANSLVVLTTGSPFHVPNFPIGQLNNLFGFPAAGLAVLTRKAHAITDELGESVAQANVEFLINHYPKALKDGMLCPPIESIFEMTKNAINTRGSQRD